MKKVLAIMLTLAMIVAFAGCGCSDKTYAAEHEITGDVLEANSKTITIETDADEILKFNYEDALVDDTNAEYDYGQVATVTYNGEIKDGDTSDCEVTHIVVTKGDERYATGKLAYVDDTESIIAIQTDDEEVLAFDVEGAERHYDNGLKIGDDMVVIYMGRINGEDTSKLRVTAVVDETVYDMDTKADKVTVKVVDENVWTKGDVNIREGSSTTSEVVKEVNKGTKLHRTGVLSNGWSRVEYKGKDRYVVSDAITTKEPKATTTAKPTSATTTTKTTTTTTTATKTTATTTTATQTTTATTATETTTTTEQPTTEPTTEVPEVSSPIKGVIKDFTATDSITRMVIDCGNGVIYDMDVSKAEIHLLEGPTVGQEVVVEFDGKIKGSDTSGITVKLVRCAD